ncbi:MAG: hypothetical protein ACEPOW_10615 [Bacteroidales bacterium]
MPKSIIQKVREKIGENDFPVNTLDKIMIEGDLIQERDLINHISDLRIGEDMNFTLSAFVSSPIMKMKKYSVRVQKNVEDYSVEVCPC